MDSNIIRANPNFHNKPRYDFALVKVHGNQCIIVQVLYILRITFREVKHHMALVLPFDVPKLLLNRRRDTDLRLTRLRPRPRASSLFIDTNSIIRGALLAEDPASQAGEYFVVDFIDQDMWARLKSIELITHAVL